MAYVPNCKCDVFVSFAHLDDVAIGNGRLGFRLRRRPEEGAAHAPRRARGKGARDLFHRPWSLEVGLNLERRADGERRSSATFVAVTSPAYVADDSWTMRELAAFQEATGGAGRIFAIEHFPLDRPEDYPAAAPRPEADGVLAEARPSAKSRSPWRAGSEAYLQTLLDLAEQIRKQLKKMREEQKAARPHPIAARMSAASPGRRRPEPG